MIEGIAMVTVLAGMGVYFVKSADLPKDLKERSAQLKSESSSYIAPEKNKFSHLTNKTAEVKAEINIEIKRETSLQEMRERAEVAASQKLAIEESIKAQKLAKIELLNREIDELTLAITTLEQELKLNNKRNIEIEIQIATHLTRLQALKEIQIS
jgi:hypothetical protein